MKELQRKNENPGMELKETGAIDKLRKQFSVEVWRESEETNERYLAWRERHVNNCIDNMFAELERVKTSCDIALKHLEIVLTGRDEARTQRDTLLAAAKQAQLYVNTLDSEKFGREAQTDAAKKLAYAIAEVEGNYK